MLAKVVNEAMSAREGRNVFKPVQTSSQGQ
jgi:hypothetical protein